MTRFPKQNGSPRPKRGFEFAPFNQGRPAG